MNTLVLRPEEAGDIRAVNALIKAAFWGYMGPTCNEHYLAHLIRQSPGYVPALSYVALVGDTLAGSVIYSMAAVVTRDGRRIPVLNFGPLSVRPDLRYTGVGTALMKHTIAEARTLGYGAIIFFGHPDYYPRLGFKRAAQYGVTAKNGAVFDAHMAMELIPGYLEPGIFAEDAAFAAAEDAAARSGACPGGKPPSVLPDAASAALDNKTALADFDMDYPQWEPAHMPPAGPLLERLAALGALEAAASLEAHKITTLARFFQYSGREIAAWPGVNGAVMAAIDAALQEAGYPKKVWP